MGVALLRVDDRLLHGQVAVGWAWALGSDLIVVANDEVAGDQWLRRLYVGAGPPGVTVKTWTLRETADQMESQVWASENAIVVVKSLRDLVALIELGVRFKEANIGGMHFEEGKRELLPYVFVSDDDVQALRKLTESGVTVTAQDVPGAKRYDVRSLLDKVHLEA